MAPLCDVYLRPLFFCGVQRNSCTLFLVRHRTRKEYIMFAKKQFEAFNQTQLDKAMTMIQQDIQPLFQQYGKLVSDEIYKRTNSTTQMPIHIAKHLRRTVHPPESTWVAIGGDNRGYKKYPHFQIGMNAEYVFAVLALIDNPIYEQEIFKYWEQHRDAFSVLSDDYVVIPDHTQLKYIPQTEVQYADIFKRGYSVKKAEFMVGRLLLKGDAQLENDAQLTQWLLDTMMTLLPMYQDAMSFYQN